MYNIVITMYNRRIYQMNSYTTLSEFVEQQMTKFGIEKNEMVTHPLEQACSVDRRKSIEKDYDLAILLSR